MQAVFRVMNCFIVILLCFCPLGEQLGTTPNIRDIVIGRCYDYMTLNPGTRYDCKDIWWHFETMILRQPSCNVTVEDYHKMFHLMTQNWPCDTSLLWSKTRALVHSYAAVLPHLWTLEDTLVGYMFNDLMWCRQHEDTDFDFGACPEWSSCQNHPVYSLWLLASQNFAEMACGNVTVLLNGSIGVAFNRTSMFGSVELDSLSPQRVHYVNIHVVASLMGPQIESCSQGSVVELIQILQTRGFRWTCTDNDQMLMMLQCIQSQDSCRVTKLKSTLFTHLN
ncbi:ADP-ribosyl cyclase/cyclic ADP-ribose hydrolase 1-like [Boleophthalmus pectinirostris]|uniref:ADP-ribosyl cyclase/cyclic ADP-ribose hydrolase 1-like n=1 Tax=Boleophthalmus pectinirostris TaxID=150288 RepID=UPI000A1C70B1|nr:ADP-ribosyl cyclase/cyclic ADP-ribose hydrolase 1-like [Boleophthalmus pectinirostris]